MRRYWNFTIGIQHINLIKTEILQMIEYKGYIIIYNWMQSSRFGNTMVRYDSGNY